MARTPRVVLGISVTVILILSGTRFLSGRSPSSPVPARPAAHAVTPRIDPRPGDVFVDVTADAGLDFVHVLVDGEMSNVVENLGSGAAVLDYDGDGWLDVYFVQGGWAPGIVEGKRPPDVPTNRLYRNRGDGNFEDVTDRARVGDTGMGLAAVAADYDGDGRTDLYVCNAGDNRLYRNRGDGTFEDVTARAGVGVPGVSAGATFLDYDGDGFLDLYVTNYVEFDPDYVYHYGPDAFPPPVAFEAQPDVLFRNRGDGTFEDVSAQSGVTADAGRGMSVVACDFNEDGLPDLFVANDGTANFLWINHGDGTFAEEAIVAGVGFGENGEATGAMTADVGDFDADGQLDLFVTDTAFSSLYRRTAPGSFADVVVASGVALLTGQYVSWGGGFLDFDGDSDLDLFVVNGDLHHVVGWEDLLLRNDGTGIFSDAADVSAYFDAKLMGRGAAIFDYDNDGDPDLLVTNLADRPVLLRNDSGVQNGRLSVSLADAGANRMAYGARVLVHLADRTIPAPVRCPTSYLCSGDPRLLIGLGPDTVVRAIEVVWPDGQRQIVHDVPAGGSVTIRREST